MNPLTLFPGLLLVLFLGVAACGGGSDGATSDDANGATTQADGLSADQLENGIGPVRSVDLGAGIDAALAAQGEASFQTKCATCHKFDTRYVGPPLGDVLSRRTPAYVMNMMLNPADMVASHPEAKALLAQFMVPMPDQNLTEDEARAILEYIRDNQTEADDDDD